MRHKKFAMLFAVLGLMNSFRRNTTTLVKGKRIGLVTALGLFISSLCLGWSFLPAAPQLPRGLFLAYGPADFVRGNGKPAPDTRSFTLLNTQTQYKLQIFNGGLDSQFAGASSAVVTLNGQQVASPSDFNQNVRLIERPLNPALANSLMVELRSAPKSGISLQVVGVDNNPPTINASATPSANANGWNNSNVAVSFTCGDSISGIETCSSPVGVTGEGAGQVVTGTATDRAQNTSHASLTINLDKTAPSINAAASPSANANGWNNTDVTVNFNCGDNLSGIQNCSSPVTVTAEGAGQLVTGTAMDRAQNSRQASLTVNLDKTAPVITISSPASGSAVTDPNVTLTGTVTDSTSGVDTITCGGSPATFSGANFTCDRPLVLGANAISVEASDRAGNRTSTVVNVTRNPEVIEEEEADIKNARLAPDVIFVGESEEVTFSASIPYDVSSGAPQVSLQRIDTAGNVLVVEGVLVDNGDAAQGDLLAGDGLFSFRRTYAPGSAEQLSFRIAYQRDGAELKSDALQLGFYHHLTDAQIESIKSTQHGAGARYQSLLASLGKAQAVETLLAELRQNPTVLQATVDEPASSISILYAPGILGGLSLDPPGTRGGGTSSPSTLTIPPASTFSTAPLQLQSEGGDEEDDENRIGNKRALILSPFRADFAPWDEGELFSQMLRGSECPAYNIEYYSENVGVNYLWNLDRYGVIVIVSHGDIQSSFNHPGWHHLPPNSDMVAISMHDNIDAEGVFRLHEKDLFAGRLAIRGTNSDSFFAALPNYIEYYTAGEMPKSMVYVGACHSLDNNTMAQAFLGRGAQTYFGYSNPVSSDFAYFVAMLFADSYFGAIPHTTGGPDGAFTPGQIDPALGAEFKMLGSATLNRPSAGFSNGNFEKGSLESWGFAFDSRVLRQLGNIGPASGDYMGMVSKSDAWFGWLQQEFCLDTDVTRIEFDWNLITEQQCDSLSSGADVLWIRLTGDDLYHQLITTDVREQCGKFRPTTADLPSEGTASATGWQHASLDITEVAQRMNGKKVQLVFEVAKAVNNGDVTIDSAVLIDNVKIVR